ncbi:Fe(3+) dicitrate ABC transporter ATP-binding protein FecE [Marinomonas epiphytica]
MALSAHQLTLGYRQKTIVKNVSFAIPEGKITALIGPNGCGKSTLLKAFSRALSPWQGKVCWHDKDLTSISQRDLAKQLALLPQTQPIPEGVLVKDIVAYGRSPYTGFWGKLNAEDQGFVSQAMEDTGIEPLAEQAISELSGGQRQRVWLAMTLAQNTPYLLLDEPTTYMDLNHQVELMQLLKRLNQQGKTIVTVLHDINQAARYCDHLMVMKDGQLITQGAPDTVLTETLLKDVFSVSVSIHKDPIAHTPMCIVNS